MKKTVLKMLCVFTAVVLLLSVFVVTGFNSVGSDSTEYFMVDIQSIEEISRLKRSNAQILYRYRDYALVDMDLETANTLQNQGMEMNPLIGRTELSIKGHVFDINEGLPRFDTELTIDGYSPGEEGIYLIHVLGPVSSSWRAELEEMGVKIINYQPNFAFEVVMTPELADRVEDLWFVDWIGIYQPGFKLAEGLEPGMVRIRTTDGNKLLTVVEDESEFVELANKNDVYYISNYVEPQLWDEMATQTIGGGLWVYDDDDDPDTAYREHGDYGSFANQIGYKGAGVVTAVADTGLGDGTTPNAGHQDFTGRVLGGYDFGDETDAEGSWNDGHGHGTHCTGSVGGDTYHGTGSTVYEDYYSGQGSAPETDLFALRIFDGGGSWIGPTDSYVRIITEARDRSGAYVHSNSWGAETAGEYTLGDEEFDMLTRDAGDGEPMVIFVAAGNSGSGSNTIGSPANGKNIISIGATENYGSRGGNPDNMAGFSSRGWTNDNRVKPDVVAPGDNVESTMPGGGYGSMSGTSMACPAAAGAGTVIVDWYDTHYGSLPNPSMVKALMVNTAYNLANNNGGENSPHIPNQDEGWGMVNLPQIVDPPVDSVFVDETSVLSTGDVDEYMIEYQDDGEPLRITLVWSDAQAMDGDDPTLKNDLNLEVISPTGDVYRGNNLVESWSEPGESTYGSFDSNGDGWDDVNNVENVFIRDTDLEEGFYTVRIHGYDVPDPVVGTGQDYALVMYNAVDEVPGEPPEITISQPSGGEVLTADTQEDILWNTQEGDDPVDHVDLYYSVDNGDSWNLIESGLPDTSSYTWTVPNEQSTESLIRANVRDTSGRSGEDISGVFTIEGTPPEPPSNLVVEHEGLGDGVLFADDVSEDLGYISGTSGGLVGWDIRDHGSVIGDHSWDWGDGQYDKVGGGAWLISPEIMIPESADSIELTFQHWRDIADTWDGVNLKISTDGETWDLIEDPEPGYDHTIGTGYSNPIEGEDAWGGTVGWEEVTVDLTDNIGETIQIRWDAGAEDWTTDGGAGWRIDDISVTAEGVPSDGDEHNLITWDASPDDPDEVSGYNIYRSEDQNGPWDETTLIDSLTADGSATYDYLDQDKGMADEIFWWYVVRAVGTNGMEEENTDSVQEPGGDALPTMDIQLSGDGDGWNFVSFNLEPGITDLESILEHEDYGIAGNYDSLMYFDSGSWYSYVPDRADHFNNLGTWDHTMGVWIRMNVDDTLTVEGNEPGTTTITLDPGWNMVGLPSSTAGNHDLPAEVTTVGHFDPAQAYNIAYVDAAGYEFSPGEGYWLYNDGDHTVDWTVEY